MFPNMIGKKSGLGNSHWHYLSPTIIISSPPSFWGKGKLTGLVFNNSLQIWFAITEKKRKEMPIWISVWVSVPSPYTAQSP